MKMKRRENGLPFRVFLARRSEGDKKWNPANSPCLFCTSSFQSFWSDWGFPFSSSWVPPNPLYGFRTPATLQDADVWYPVNRTTGLWLVVTGAVTGGVSIWTFAAGFGLPAAPLVNLTPVVLGVVVMIVHGSVVSRRLKTSREEAETE